MDRRRSKMFQKENYKMIVTDLDGTLLDKDGKISPYTIDILKKVKEQSYYLTIATGRSLYSVQNAIPDVSFFDYLLLNNGVYCYSPKKEQGTYFGFIKQEEIEDLIANFDQDSSEIDFCSAYNYYIYKAIPKRKLDFIKGIKNISEIKEKITKINFFPKDQTELLNLYQEFKTKYQNLDIMVMQESNTKEQWLVLMPKDVNKKTSVEKVCQNLGITLQQVIAFGDAKNDLPLIKESGYSITVSTALEEVKEVATQVLEGEEGDTIAHFLEKNIL